MSFNATYLGSSGWVIEIGNHKILIDPWLTGELVFPPGPWLIKGRLGKNIDVPIGITLILLTQGLADHCHRPSLEILSRSIPVLGSPSAAKVVRDIGFESVFELRPGEVKFFDDLKIEASEGAPVPNIENGYLIYSDDCSLYFEPHGFLDSNISECILDAVITPVVNLKLPIAGEFIKGKKTLPELVKRFQPLNILASTTGGDSNFSGILNNLITVEGSAEEMSKTLDKKINFIDPLPGNLYKIKTHKDNI